MKTIAITIDQESLTALDRLARSPSRGGGAKGANRSAVVRRAVQEYIARHGKRDREQEDGKILRAHRELITRQAALLVADQADR